VSLVDSPSRHSDIVAPEHRRLLAMGGHEFARRQGNEALRDYLLGLARTDNPRVCLLPTASGDPEEQITAFRRSLADSACEVSHLSLFRLDESTKGIDARLLEQDIVYVGGGSMLNLLAIWRAHRIDTALVRAWERGVVICGQSAGAMCWFEFGISRSQGVAKPVKGLGLLPGSLSVHYHSDPERRRAFLHGVGLVLPPGWGVDDQAGLLFAGTEPKEAVSGREGAGAWYVKPDGEGGTTEEALSVRRLEDPRPAIDTASDDVAEMRRVRSLRSR
jgi:dipeptidase E